MTPTDAERGRNRHTSRDLEPKIGKPMNESQILAAIRKDLGREPDLVLWRLSQGGAVTRGGQTYRAGLSVNGASDLIGMLTVDCPGAALAGWDTPTCVARFFALEVKAPRGRLSDEQTLFLALVRKRGGFAACVRSVEQARAALERARRGASE